MSSEMREFLDKVDLLCFEYGYEIWATDVKNYTNEDGSYPTFTVHGVGGDKVDLAFIDGDGIFEG